MLKAKTTNKQTRISYIHETDPIWVADYCQIVVGTNGDHTTFTPQQHVYPLQRRCVFAISDPPTRWNDTWEAKTRQICTRQNDEETQMYPSFAHCLRVCAYELSFRRVGGFEMRKHTDSPKRRI